MLVPSRCISQSPPHVHGWLLAHLPLLGAPVLSELLLAYAPCPLPGSWHDAWHMAGAYECLVISERLPEKL